MAKLEVSSLDFNLLFVTLVFWHVDAFNRLGAELSSHSGLNVSCDELALVSLMFKEHYLLGGMKF